MRTNHNRSCYCRFSQALATQGIYSAQNDVYGMYLTSWQSLSCNILHAQWQSEWNDKSCLRRHDAYLHTTEDNGIWCFLCHRLIHHLAYPCDFLSLRSTKIMMERASRCSVLPYKLRVFYQIGKKITSLSKPKQLPIYRVPGIIHDSPYARRKVFRSHECRGGLEPLKINDTSHPHPTSFFEYQG